jgi:hypothetical protein
VIVKNRGFFDFGSSEPITGVLQGEFRGFGKGRATCWTTARNGSRPTAPAWSGAQAIANVSIARRDGRLVHEGGRREQQPKVRRTK